jgi:hypothetical protein
MKQRVDFGAEDFDVLRVGVVGMPRVEGTVGSRISEEKIIGNYESIHELSETFHKAFYEAFYNLNNS